MENGGHLWSGQILTDGAWSMVNGKREGCKSGREGEGARYGGKYAYPSRQADRQKCINRHPKTK